MENSFYIKKNNKNIKCDILYVFSNNDNNFVIYNDGSLDNDGFLNVLANKFILNNNTMTLLPIEDNEWSLVNNVWDGING